MTGSTPPQPASCRPVDRRTPGRIFVALLSILGITATPALANEGTGIPRSVYSLPSHIAEELRNLNAKGQRGSCNESRIFIHGFHSLDALDSNGRNKIIGFLGAPDYLCQTKSFVTVIVDSSGSWTVGKSSVENWDGSRLLAGVPKLFQQLGGIGYFLISQWQVEGPLNLAYFSTDGETWTPVKLPTAEPSSAETDCCDAPSITRLCVRYPDLVSISYAATPGFNAGVWRAPIDGLFPHDPDWSRVPDVDENAQCDRSWPEDSLRLSEKSDEAAILEIIPDWAILIPGPIE